MTDHRPTLKQRTTSNSDETTSESNNDYDDSAERSSSHDTVGRTSNVGLVQRAISLTNEANCYALVLICLSVYSLAYIWAESVDISEELARRNNRSLGKGWRLMSRKQDIADFEWLFWFSNMRDLLIVVYTAHVIVSFLSSFFVPQHRNINLFLCGVISVYFTIGGVCLVWISLICIAYFYAAKQRSIVLVSGISLGTLLAIQQLPHAEYSGLDGDGNFSVLATSSLTFTVFRCCSFALEFYRSNNDARFRLLDIFQYNFYIPYFFFGPVMTYQSFLDQKGSFSRNSLRIVALDIVQVAAYVAVVDFLRHFLHFSSLPLDQEFLENAPFLVIGFLAFANFYLDWMKGRILYAIASGIARDVDGFTDAPKCCKNVARIYTFADTYFDRSLQHWLCKYVYDPFAEGHFHVQKEALAAGLSFLIVVFMQGIGWQVFVWAFLNWLGLSVEFYFMQKFGSTQRKRIFAVVLGINYWCIVLFNCIAINGFTAFTYYFDRLFVRGGIIGFLCTSFIGYCYVFLNMKTNKEKQN